jgi:hypothetical protein
MSVQDRYGEQMRILKRNPNTSVGSTINLWLIPMLAYLFEKVAGMTFNEYEFIWWIAIPIFFISWLIINFKIVNE